MAHGARENAPAHRREGSERGRCLAISASSGKVYLRRGSRPLRGMRRGGLMKWLLGFVGGLFVGVVVRDLLAPEWDNLELGKD